MKNLIFLFFFLFFSYTIFSQKDTLSIIRHTDKDIVFPKDLKVVYRGMYNYLSIEVPNCKSFTATGIGLHLVTNQIYTLSPQEGIESIINVEIVLKNNKIISEKHSFKVKNLPRPISHINFSDSNYVKMTKSQLKNAIISVNLGDKNLKMDFKIIGFNLKISGKKCLILEGNKIDEKTFNLIDKYCQRYDQITIFDIKAKCPIEGCVLINPIIIEIF
jgi:GldM C-terminal domain